MRLMARLWSLWRVPSGKGCRGCRFFETDARTVEAQLPGMASLSSAHAAVRGGDGLCIAHGRLINGRRVCASYQR